MSRMLFRQALPILLIVCLLCSSLASCCINSKHLEVSYESNDNEDIHGWGDDAQDWDGDNVTTWDKIEEYEYANIVYNQLIFEDVLEEAPIVDCVILDYKSNGKYFDGDTVYSMVNDKFDANSFVTKYATGTGIIIVGVIFNIIRNGVPESFMCLIEGAANIASGQIRGTAFGAGIRAVVSAIKGQKGQEIIFDSLEGSADGYMWAAIYGTISGEYSKNFCFTENTLIQTKDGLKPIAEVQTGDLVLAYNEDDENYDYKAITQITKSYAYKTVEVIVNNECFESTLSHPFMTSTGWKQATDLHEGDAVKSANNEYKIISAIKYIQYTEPKETYTLCVDDYHSFLIGESGIVVHNKCNINGDHAGEIYHPSDPELNAKYPDGVKFSEAGFPDFSKYAINSVSFDYPSAAAKATNSCLTGVDSHDFALANKAVGYAFTPKGYTWHHNENMMTLELVPTDLHMAVRHTGGASLIRNLLAGV